MASYTPNLNLLMKDPVADGADTFNIETMLNQNWEKIDRQVLRAIAAAADYDQEATYQKGDFCTRSGLLYRANQVIAQPEEWTAGHWTAISITDVIRGLTAADVGAAPEGYGLGSYAGNIPGNDANNAIYGGWYVFFSSTQNTPFLAGKLLVLPYTSNLNYPSQIAFIAEAPYSFVAIRNCVGGTWGPWRYVNYPAYIGTEYLTDEQYNGKPVYAKVVNLGALPNATTAAVTHDISNMQYCVSATGAASNGTNIPCGNFGGIANDAISVSVDATNIYITTTRDHSELVGTVLLKYTKTTD